MKITWERYVAQFQNISDAVEVLWDDYVLSDMTDVKVKKLLRLASCPSAPVGEKTNAAKMAFKFMQELQTA